MPDIRELMHDYNASGTAELWLDTEHVVPYWVDILKLGFPGLLARVRKYHQACMNPAPKKEALKPNTRRFCGSFHALPPMPAHISVKRADVLPLPCARFETAVDTCGHVSQEAFDKVLPYTDLFLYDIKAIDEEVHLRCTGHSNKCIVENLRYLQSCGKAVEIRVPYVPGFNGGQKDKF